MAAAENVELMEMDEENQQIVEKMKNVVILERKPTPTPTPTPKQIPIPVPISRASTAERRIRLCRDIPTTRAVVNAIIEVSKDKDKLAQLRFPLNFHLDRFLRHHLQLPGSHILRHVYVVNAALLMLKSGCIYGHRLQTFKLKQLRMLTALETAPKELASDQPLMATTLNVSRKHKYNQYRTISNNFDNNFERRNRDMKEHFDIPPDFYMSSPLQSPKMENDNDFNPFEYKLEPKRQRLMSDEQRRMENAKLPTMYANDPFYNAACRPYAPATDYSTVVPFRPLSYLTPPMVQGDVEECNSKHKHKSKSVKLKRKEMESKEERSEHESCIYESELEESRRSVTPVGTDWFETNTPSSPESATEKTVLSDIGGKHNASLIRKTRRRRRSNSKNEFDPFGYKIEPKKSKIMSDEKRFSPETALNANPTNILLPLNQPDNINSTDWDAILESYQMQLKKLIKDLEESIAKDEEKTQLEKSKPETDKDESRKRKDSQNDRKSQEKRLDYIPLTSTPEPRVPMKQSPSDERDERNENSFDNGLKALVATEPIQCGRIGRVASLSIESAPSFQHSQFQNSSIDELVYINPKQVSPYYAPSSADSSPENGNSQPYLSDRPKALTPAQSSTREQEEIKEANYSLQGARLRQHQIEILILNLQERMDLPCTSREAIKFNQEMDEYRRKLDAINEMDTDNMDSSSTTSSSSSSEDSKSLQLEISDRAYAKLLYQSFIESIEYKAKSVLENKDIEEILKEDSADSTELTEDMDQTAETAPPSNVKRQQEG